MEIDAKVAFWTGALINLGVIVASALLGVARARRLDYAGHKRRMLTSAALVVAFLIAYPIKLATLGREQLELWDPLYVHVLRFHELCVAVMVLGMATAIVQARRLGLPLGPGSAHPSPERLARGIRIHRTAGLSAVIGSILGLLSAAVVLQGMYARL